MIDKIPAYAIPIDKNDRIVYDGWSIGVAASVQLRIRTIGPDGVKQHALHTITIAGGGNNDTAEIVLGGGWLMSVSAVLITTGIPPGDIFSEVRLAKEETATSGVEFILFRAYLNSGRGHSWPGHELNDIFSAVPGLSIGSPANPGVGANLSYALSDYEQSNIFSVRFRLVTDANVASRRVQLRFNRGGVILQDFVCSQTQAASLTYDYYFGVNLPAETFLNNVVQRSLSPIPLLPSSTITTSIVNIQAGDQISSVRIMRDKLINEVWA